jgi:ABC-type nitrate/sulfonate/bicarbonate transport system substrate-binding protein
MSRLVMKVERLSRWLFGGVLLIAATAALAQPAGPGTIRVIGLPARPLPIAIAESQGWFAARGLTVVTEVAPNSDVLRDALATGRADVASAAVDNGVAMAENAGVDIVIVLGGEGTQNELVAQPEITSIADLKGRTVLVDAPNTAFALQLKKMLLVNGLAAGRDYELKPLGSTPQRLQGMREHKEYAASMLGPPTLIAAKRAGFVSLGSARELLGAYQGIGQFTRREWAREHNDALVAYLAAYVEAQNWMLAPANRSKVVELLMKESRLPADVAGETYDQMFLTPGGYVPDARFDIAGFETVLKLRADVEGSWGGHPPDPHKYYDPSYYEAAMATLKSPR